MASAQSSAGAACQGVPGVESQMEELLRKIGKPVHFMERRQDTASLCLSDLARYDHDFRQAVLDSETADDRRRLPARPSQARVAAQAGGLADDKPEGPLRCSQPSPGGPGSVAMPPATSREPRESRIQAHSDN